MKSLAYLSNSLFTAALAASTLFLIGVVTSPTLAQAEAPFQLVNECKESDYVLVETSEVSVEFQGSDYTPRCLTVRPGTRVTLPGSPKHPLQGLEDVAGVPNPFRAPQERTTSVTETLVAEAYYSYHCTKHKTMTAAIRVLTP